MQPTRRTFLAAAATGFAASRFAIGQPASPNDRVTLALVGAGGRGGDLMAGFSALPNVRFKTICDVDRARGENALRALAQRGAPAAAFVPDLRRVFDDKEIDAVILATPEHWHALGTIWACQAGKDVYVEKNVSISVWEGRKMLEAARKYNRIVQAGLQNRSAPYAHSAREYIRSGRLGKVVHVKVYNMLNGAPWRMAPDSSAPATLDWDAWLGPAPKVPYNTSRHRGWYYWFDYCGGTFGGDASHQLDLARLVLSDPKDPQSVYTAGGNFAFNSDCPTPEMMAITWSFDDFTMTCESANFPPYLRKSNNEERNGKTFPVWSHNNERIEIYGTKQLMYVGRHGVGWQVMEAEGKVVAQEKGVHPDRYHQPNFIECIRTRKRPNADVEQAHQSAKLVHLANTAYRVGKKLLTFDSATETFPHQDEANRLLRPPYREGYQVPEQV